MRCIDPITIKNPYLKEPRPHVEYEPPKLSVPCGKCGACLHRRQSDWQFRLTNEDLSATNSFFITLTYQDVYSEALGGYMTPTTLDKKHLQDFFKRVRKQSQPFYDQRPDIWPKTTRFRYYAVGEYGTITERPHYHVIAFNIPEAIIQQIRQGKIWDYGLTHVGGVSPKSIAYVTRYVVTSREETKKKRLYLSSVL